MAVRILFIACAFILCTDSYAQTETPVSSITRSITALPVKNAPVIDGIPDDDCWRNADWQGDFIQLKPTVGAKAQTLTQVAVTFDKKHIYVALRCVNPTGSSANSTITRRDGNLDLDNSVTLYLDSFHSRRDCYYFSTNSLGTQIDGRIGEDGRTNDKSWDCTWHVASKEDSTGWTSEMSIPVNEIRFPVDSTAPWGINFRRNYPDLLEQSFWSEQDRAWQVSHFGDLDGLSGFRKTCSVSLYPYMVTLDSNTDTAQRKTVYSSGGTEVVAGGDLRFNIGSAASGNLTYNPDFATVEADQEVINLTRYEVSFPEKRLYFLEGAELFSNRIRVFYSRRIGDIDYGLKSSGRHGKFNYAFLTARERSHNGEPSSQTSVVRLQRDVFGSSNIGILAVDRSYADEYNRVVSTDAVLYLPSHVKVTSQFVGSFPSEGDEFSNAWFVRAARETDIYHYHLRYTNIDPGFRENVNEVGFIPDDNRRELDSDIIYNWWLGRHGIEKVNFFWNGNVFWGHGGALRNMKFTNFTGLTFTNKWTVGFSTNYRTEVFDKKYYNHTILPEIGYNLEQWNSYSLLYQHGRNFGSDLNMWIFRSRFKPGDKLSLEYRFRHVKLYPDPNERAAVLNVVTADYNFTPDIWLRLFTQANSRNDRFYVYGLLGWRFAPPFGALYLAYTADRQDDFLAVPSRQDERTLFVKLTVPVSL